MDLTSRSFLVLLALLAIGAGVATAGWSPRVRGPAPLQFAQRAGLVTLCQVLAVLLAGTLVNDQYSFYVSWSDLLGSPSHAGPIVASSGGGGALPAGHSRPLPGGARELDLRVNGRSSHFTGAVRVYLPAGYGNPENAHRRYPVVELITGYHGNPESWDTAFNLPFTLAQLVSDRSVRPFIAVAPVVDLRGERDLECTDVPGGPKAESWLGADMRQLMLRRFRAQPARAAWGILGYSSGGYCALKLLLHHPTWYHSVIAMDGYFFALKDGQTGDLWGGDHLRRKRNDDIWLLQHGVHPDGDVLVFSSRQDQESYPSTQTLLSTALPPLRISKLIVDRGGHNLEALLQALPQMLTWMSQHLLDGPDPGETNRTPHCPYCTIVFTPSGTSARTPRPPQGSPAARISQNAAEPSPRTSVASGSSSPTARPVAPHSASPSATP